MIQEVQCTCALHAAVNHHLQKLINEASCCRIFLFLFFSFFALHMPKKCNSRAAAEKIKYMMSEKRSLVTICIDQRWPKGMG